MLNFEKNGRARCDGASLAPRRQRSRVAPDGQESVDTFLAGEIARGDVVRFCVVEVR
jgi:hypothetical protein